MRIETLRESKASTLALSEVQADSLVKLGRRLASDKSWWGGKPAEDRTVIQCKPVGGELWSVTVNDAVGVISVADLQLAVAPKIPTQHLIYLLSKSRQLPRMDDQAAFITADAGLWELMARWFVRSAAAVLRRDLIRDYRDEREALRTVRGQIDALPTARAFYVGRLDIHCRFQEFLEDTPLNRLLKAAARAVRRSTLLSIELRRDAARLLSRLHDVSELQASDLRAVTDRRTSHYADAVTLGKQILKAIGRGLDSGHASAWTFLIRTPELVEAGLRESLVEAIGSHIVTKRGRQLIGSLMTVNPDLVFSDDAVGDVKYKIWDGQPNRADLYQAVAFATAFEVRHGSIFDFATNQQMHSDITFGDVMIRRFSWNCAIAEPSEAAAYLTNLVRTWLGSVADERRVAS